MKKYLEFEEMKKMIYNKIPQLKLFNFDEVVAISRGGVTIGHIISKELKLQLGYFFPNKEEIVFYNKHPKNILVVEDLIAEGRTTRKLHDVMRIKYSNIKYYYLPFLVDANYKYTNFDDYCLKTNDWIVFPWEKFESMTEGDRGLFRDKTDIYKGQ